MTPIDVELVARKTSHLEELVGMLEAESKQSLEHYLGHRRDQLLFERLLHLSVEAASDLLDHLLVQGAKIKAETYADTFLKAGQVGLISPGLACGNATCSCGPSAAS